MIFFGSNKKIFLIVIVALGVTGFIFSEWVKREPFGSIDRSSNVFWQNIFEAGDQTVDKIQDSTVLGISNAKNFADEVQKEEQRSQLIDEAKKYLENKVDVNEWEIYKNDKYNFSIAIPPGYKNRAVYEDFDIPLSPDLSAFYLVYSDKSISMDTESEVLYDNTDTLENILAQRAEEYGYQIININNVVLYKNNDFPENGNTIFTAMADRILLFTFRNIDNNTIDAMINTFKFTD
ncbi:hypothetical protein KKH39_00595 [Patescibacteria group bacterium]|nr:hypothetical protein [Patescibacteria group bacterium]